MAALYVAVSANRPSGSVYVIQFCENRDSFICVAKAPAGRCQTQELQWELAQLRIIM